MEIEGIVCRIILAMSVFYSLLITTFSSKTIWAFAKSNLNLGNHAENLNNFLVYVNSSNRGFLLFLFSFTEKLRLVPYYA